MPADNPKLEPGAEWRAIAQRSGSREFAAAFTVNPMLEASVLNDALIGVDAIDAFSLRPPTACTSP
jgi:hypothetical protein